jgi:YesN/AraC family two-component response regulator
LVFFRPSKERKTEGLLELKRLLSDLNRAFLGASFSDLEVLRDEFLQQVLTLSFQTPEETRWHLQYALMQLMETVKNRKSLGEREANHLYENLALAMERAGTTQEMVLAFQEALLKLSERMAGKETFLTAYSIERVRDYIDEHFREPLRIGRLAKIAKVSVSTFGRRFKKLTGVGLEPYLQNLRIAEAKRLLKTGNLPVFQVGRDNGFKSNSYFVQLFKKKTGLSPQKFRRKFQRI